MSGKRFRIYLPARLFQFRITEDNSHNEKKQPNSLVRMHFLILMSPHLLAAYIDKKSPRPLILGGPSVVTAGLELGLAALRLLGEVRNSRYSALERRNLSFAPHASLPRAAARSPLKSSTLARFPGATNPTSSATGSAQLRAQSMCFTHRLDTGTRPVRPTKKPTR